ncbi:MAG: DUF6428 family protein [Cytophagaceae bacterium]
MKLSTFKDHLKNLSEISFRLSDGTYVPEHFHVTEVGLINKNFIDCGGTKRKETVVNFQLWTATDYEHRLGAEKLLKIIELSERELGIGDHEIEVEYQSETIGKYGLLFVNGEFILDSLQTDCLAKDKCGVEKPRIRISTKNESGECTPGGGCC